MEIIQCHATQPLYATRLCTKSKESTSAGNTEYQLNKKLILTNLNEIQQSLALVLTKFSGSELEEAMQCIYQSLPDDDLIRSKRCRSNIYKNDSVAYQQPRSITRLPLQIKPLPSATGR
jgi:hypothetical protein